MQIDLVSNSTGWLIGAASFGLGELLGLFVALGVIVIIWRARFKIIESSCGTCEYPVRGLTTDRCPECGGLVKQE